MKCLEFPLQFMVFNMPCMLSRLDMSLGSTYKEIRHNENMFKPFDFVTKGAGVLTCNCDSPDTLIDISTCF